MGQDGRGRRLASARDLGEGLCWRESRAEQLEPQWEQPVHGTTAVFCSMGEDLKWGEQSLGSHSCPE